MPEKTSPDREPTVRPLTLPINAWWRAFISAIGLAALGAGALAVFVTHLEAGPVALLVVGLILLLIGAGGRLPNRLKVGENEAAWEAVEEFVSRVAGDVPSDQTTELVHALNELGEVAPAAALAGLGAVTERITYREMVVEMLTEAVQNVKGPVALKFSPPAMGDSAVIYVPNGPHLLIQIRNRVDVNIVKEITEIATAESPRGVAKVLLISAQEPSNLASVRLMSNETVSHVRITGRDDLPKLVTAIRAAFEILD
jgi:hypothetical protein